MFHPLLIPVALTILILYYCLSTIYSLFLHPLRHIPGPKLWLIFPVIRYISAIRGRLDTDICHFHAQYGPVVRLTHDEVSFITAEAWKEIYGHGHRQLPKVLNSASNPKDIISSNDADHSRFRKALSHAFSAKGLQAQEPLINSYIDKLIARLQDIAESQLPADMTKWYNLATFDIIGDLAFGEPFGGLESSKYHHWVATVFESVKLIPFTMLKDQYPMIFGLLSLFVPQTLLDARKRQDEHTRITVQKRLQHSSADDRADFMDSMLRHRGGEKEDAALSDEELVANASILIIAGSETTATLLSGLTYWLLRSPDVLATVTAEVRSVMKTEAEITSAAVAAKLPYLLACIEEALRMYPPVPTGLQRITLDPISISGYDIPPGTKVSVHHMSAYRSPINFHAPDRFIPERWLPDAKTNPNSPFYSDRRDVLQPFSAGPRNCIGRNLAFAEMRVIFARVLWSFDLQLCEESVHWCDQKTYTLWEKHPLMCRLSLRSSDAP
ncbi:cytochrome P450 [Aspergillus homomorphus CBS 101889]|uniref:Cytochrome P450 n=1 Tax=Aspergillus homomorphus (strain CBS 101889) TaxID=1450537 RepID=A0A395I7F2_ASPHC|nr:cytochrome P450 [Aspergillus homomorphus CBS 101889]RAL15855.1 cytochrome P450 [Aspergillus homomorphus CBS 101889]